MFTKWVKMKIVIEATGFTEHAIRGKIKKNKIKGYKWQIGKLWKHDPDGMLVFNLKEIEAWMGS